LADYASEIGVNSDTPRNQNPKMAENRPEPNLARSLQSFPASPPDGPAAQAQGDRQ
jgi:hypothetical protein